MIVQSVLIDRSVYPNVYKAINKLLKMGFEYNKIDVTENNWRFRQREPDDKKKYMTKNTNSSGVKIIVQY